MFFNSNVLEVQPVIEPHGRPADPKLAAGRVAMFLDPGELEIQPVIEPQG